MWSNLGTSMRNALQLEIDTVTTLSQVSNAMPFLLLDQREADLLPIDNARLQPIPDSYFKDEPWLAPHLLLLSLPADHSVLQEALASAILSAPERLQPQRVSALLLASCDSDVLLAHLCALSLQHDPTEMLEPACVLRYQDPRVMQRVWATLSDDQRCAWLGPVRHWYAAAQPVGRIPAKTVIPSALWHAGPASSDARLHSRMHHLLDPAQWRMAHSAPAENSFWQRISTKPPSGQVMPCPSVDTLRHWLSEAALIGLAGNDQTDWALCRWSTSQDYWMSVLGQRQSRAAHELQRQRPGLGFADAWRTVGRDL